jgi:hypothetical protein
MKATTMSLVMLLAPAALFAQASGQAGAQGSSSTTAKTTTATKTSSAATVSANAAASAKAGGDFKAPSSFSAEGQAKLNAMYAEAKEHHVPREPMAKRVDEGRAKGANETAVIASAGKVKANLEASQEAMVAAGRSHPSDEECERGEAAMERGVTKAQITAIAKSSPGDRSLVVAFDVLTRLAARGVPVTQAVAQVQSNMTSGASDAALNALVSASANSNGANSNGANAAANAGANAATTAKPLTGTVTGTLGGAVKKP